MWWTPQGYIELISEKEILDFKPAPRLEQIADKRPKQIEDRAHRVGSCADSPHRTNPCGYDFRERQWVVGQCQVFARILEIGRCDHVVRFGELSCKILRPIELPLNLTDNMARERTKVQIKSCQQDDNPRPLRV
jgi:hypothetical protein